VRGLCAFKPLREGSDPSGGRFNAWNLAFNACSQRESNTDGPGCGCRPLNEAYVSVPGTVANAALTSASGNGWAMRPALIA